MAAERTASDRRRGAIVGRVVGRVEAGRAAGLARSGAAVAEAVPAAAAVAMSPLPTLSLAPAPATPRQRPRPVAGGLRSVEGGSVELPGALPAALVVALADLGSAAVVVGSDGEVLAANRAAVALGIVRRGRLQVDELATAARSARAEQRPQEASVSAGWLGRHRPDGAGPALAARVRPLIGTEVPEAVLLLVEDRSQAMRVLAARQDFVVNVSHELKTPVGAIALLAEALQEAADDPEAVTRFARRIGLESVRLTKLVKEIVELSRVQLDDPTEDAEPIRLAEVVAAAVDQVGVDADSKNIAVECFVGEDLTVRGSRQDLTSAVGNLVGNALSYSPVDTRVTVSASRVDEAGRSMVDLAVSDQGIGVAPDKLSRIFERFYRVDEARSRSTGGTGLGLSIVKHVATGHGGSVRVWSVPGTGSTFTLRLPLVEPVVPRLDPQPGGPDRVPDRHGPDHPGPERRGTERRAHR